MTKKTAIFGGSFNPVHNGHLALAKHVLESTDISKIVFLPNANPPHKENQKMPSGIHRYNMVALAIEGISDFEISDYEIKTQKPSYTIDTMRYMKGICPDELYFIIGADSLYTLNTWKNYDELIKECSFIVADRNCIQGDDISTAIADINNKGGMVLPVSMPKIDITSTMIRKAIFRGGDVSSYIPESVREYIDKNNLYKCSPEG